MIELAAQPTSAATAASGDPRRLAAWRELGRRVDGADPRQIRQAAVQLVSTNFFAPVLEEMRKLPFGKEVGGGGRMEEALGQQLDMRVADAVAARGSGGLVDQIAAKLAQKTREAAKTALHAAWDRQLAARSAAGESAAEAAA